jgi:hypothetical protein
MGTILIGAGCHAFKASRPSGLQLSHHRIGRCCVGCIGDSTELRLGAGHPCGSIQESRTSGAEEEGTTHR